MDSGGGAARTALDLAAVLDGRGRFPGIFQVDEIVQLVAFGDVDLRGADPGILAGLVRFEDRRRPRGTGIDAFRAASDLADQVRRSLWTAYRTQRLINGKGWIGSIRESSAPQEVSDPDRPFHGRYAATYELRVRSAL